MNRKISYIDKTIEEVEGIIESKFRIVRKDKKLCIVTRDVKFDRYNFEVEDGVIVKENLG